MSIICCCDRYDKAIEIYETIAKHSMNNNLLKYSVKGYLLNAGLCQICGNDDIKVENAILRYQVSSPPSSFLVYIDDMTTSIIRLFWVSNKRFMKKCLPLQELDPTFSGTRECKFLQVFLDFCSFCHSWYIVLFRIPWSTSHPRICWVDLRIWTSSFKHSLVRT
jgi:hypothetical protein